MLPYVEAEDRRRAFGERAVLVGRGGDGELAALDRQPGQARAEPGGRRSPGGSPGLP